MFKIGKKDKIKLTRIIKTKIREI